MRVNKQRITFHAEHLEAQTGIFFQNHVYARYDNVKKVETVQIPFTDQGKLKVYVAGEQIQQQQNGQEGAGIKIPYSLQGTYIHDIASKVDAMDALMLGKIEPSEILGTHAQDDDVISVSKPAIANVVTILGLVGLIFPPLWLAIPIVAWQTAKRSYSVESDRVVERGGILFKYAVSVLFHKIDSLQQHQGALGKAYGNGQVTILTAGSSAPDLAIANIPDYQDVYGTIREKYGKG
jgi:membrane protein YdbS with pleckstrin-like domain